MKYFIGIIFLCFIVSACSFFKTIFPPSPKDVLHNQDFNWQHDSTKHFYYYYEIHSTASASIEKIKEYLENNYDNLLALLNIETYPHKIKYFILESREEMEVLFGHKTNGKAMPQDNAVYSVIGKNINALAMHEICHVIANNVLGECKEQWINEGFAVYSDDEWHGYNLHGLSKYLLMHGKIIPLNELIHNMHSHSSLITYPEAGSIVKYLYELYGFEAIKILWVEGYTGFKQATGKDLDQVETEWIKYIGKYDAQGIEYRIK